MRLLREGPAVVLSPNLDDAVFSAWTVITEPRDVVVVNICTGLPSPGTCGGWDRVVGATDSRALMGLRLAEDREALALAGRRPVNLGFLDAQYRTEALDGESLLSGLEREIAGASEIYAPAGLGRHPDHEMARELALGPAAEAGCRVFLYAELPYATRFGWPPSVTGEPPCRHLRPEARWEEHLGTSSCGSDRLTLRVHRLAPEAAAGKLQAMKAYRTQFPALNGGPLEQLSHPHVIRYEVLWELQPD